MKTEVQGIVYRLRLPLQKRLRFITQLSLAEVEAMNRSNTEPAAMTACGATPQNNNSSTGSQ